jgi:ATP-dependent Clp protease adapter protein ClpS
MIAPPKTSSLKKWNVIVHNDDVHTYDDVIAILMRLVNLDAATALKKTTEVDKKGLSIVATTHKEHAELLQEQFKCQFLTCTIEPA